MPKSTKGQLYSNDGYYEAILQIRPKDKEILSFTKEQIKKSHCLISKEDELKEGYNLQLTSKKFATELGKKLKNKFHGEIKQTHSLYGVNRLTSKRVSRLTVLFRKTL